MVGSGADIHRVTVARYRQRVGFGIFVARDVIDFFDCAGEDVTGQVEVIRDEVVAVGSAGESDEIAGREDEKRLERRVRQRIEDCVVADKRVARVRFVRRRPRRVRYESNRYNRSKNEKQLFHSFIIPFATTRKQGCFRESARIVSALFGWLLKRYEVFCSCARPIKVSIRTLYGVTYGCG